MLEIWSLILETGTCKSAHTWERCVAEWLDTRQKHLRFSVRDKGHVCKLV